MHELQLRVDANGAFSAKEVPGLLKELDHLRVHSIEQPIPKGKWKQMAKICRETSVPIALDEELIGVIDKESKIEMLETIQPKYIILKPSFLGGFKKSEEWISLAEDRGIGWWVTSALESNYGLSAISQWNYNLYGYHGPNLRHTLKVRQISRFKCSQIPIYFWSLWILTEHLFPNLYCGGFSST